MSIIEIIEGNSPLVLGLPHTGTEVPPDCLAGLNDTGRALADTDWHIDRLYAGLMPDATTVRTTIHRYVIDANRDPSGESLYPGQNTTTLCPLTDFDSAPIYLPGHTPQPTEVARRTDAYHAPYHAALSAQLERIKSKHGFALLYDCHSIRSEIPFLFEGTLPDFNIGTHSGASCDPELEQITTRICTAADGYSSTVNGRFKGGWTTRHYGQPTHAIHAIQMELAQSTYMHECPPWAYDETRASTLRSTLKTLLETLSDWRPQ